ncbi:MAG: fumarylacetoacetate hydrolase family protein [Tepidisphaeraceae bacterium]
MRLATLHDVQTNEALPVFELPGGQRVELRELFGPQQAAYAMGEMPLYFTDLSRTVSHLDDVIDAVRQWASERSEQGQAQRERSWLATEKMSFLPPIPAPRAFRNFDGFEQHVKNCRERSGQQIAAAWYEEPVFYFSNAGALVGHETPVYAPFGSEQLDFGLELGLIVGRAGRDINPRAAWRHVAGFTIINDLSARDLQQKELSAGLGPVKGKDFATAVGPYLVTLDDLRDRIDSHGRIHLQMIARVNGKEVSRGNAASMYFSWPHILEQASRDAQLFPGDLIGSGTVANGCILELGVEKVGGWLKPGDIVELEVERLGTLRTPIVARPKKDPAKRAALDDALMNV